MMGVNCWNQLPKKKKMEKAPARIEIIRNLEGNAHGIGGDVPFGGSVEAGYQPPSEIVAVMRPGSCTFCFNEQECIVEDDELEMAMAVSKTSDGCPAVVIYRNVKKPSSRNGLNGLYIFPLKEASHIFTQAGIHQFLFSVRCRDCSSLIEHETTIRVRPDEDSRCCKIVSVNGCPVDSTPVEIRIGCPVRCLSVISMDMYGNRVPLSNVSGVTITVVGGDDVLAQVKDVKTELSTDMLTLNVMDFLVETNKLDLLKPTYEAQLKISFHDRIFSIMYNTGFRFMFYPGRKKFLNAMCPCKVKPGLPSTITLDRSLLSEESLVPGRVVNYALLEVFDHCGNHVEEGTEFSVHVNGFSFLDNLGSNRKVSGEGFINLCGALRVVGTFGSQAFMTFSHHGKEIFSSIFQIAMRELKARDVGESCLAGSVLDNIIFEVYKSDGLVDESIDGPLHTLKITLNGLPLVEGGQYAIQYGKCVISRVQLPKKPGIVTILACHTHYPDLQTTIQLSLGDGSEPILSSPGPGTTVDSVHSQLITYTGVIEKTSNKTQDTDSRINSIEKTHGALYSREESLGKEIFIQKGEIGHETDAKDLTADMSEVSLDDFGEMFRQLEYGMLEYGFSEAEILLIELEKGVAKYQKKYEEFVEMWNLLKSGNRRNTSSTRITDVVEPSIDQGTSMQTSGTSQEPVTDSDITS